MGGLAAPVLWVISTSGLYSTADATGCLHRLHLQGACGRHDDSVDSKNPRCGDVAAVLARVLREFPCPVSNPAIRPRCRELLPLGELFLSNTQLQFAALQGQMKLQYVGIMPDSAGPDIAELLYAA